MVSVKKYPQHLPIYVRECTLIKVDLAKNNRIKFF